MECRLVQDPVTHTAKEVKAPNGAPSVLFEHIKKAIPDNYQPDLLVAGLFDQGAIKTFSKQDLALALYTKYNVWVDDGIIDLENTRLDQNGEAVFTEIQDAIGLPEVSDNYRLSGHKGAEVFIHDLQAKGLIEKLGEDYWLSEKATLQNDDRPGTEQNLFQVNQKLNWLGIPQDFATFQEKNGKTAVVFQPGKFVVTEKIGDYHDQVNTRFLIGYLGDRFPDLRFRFLTEEEAREVYSQLPELSSRTPFEKVNSFVHKGVVYLIEGRVTNKIAIEETLHPFIYTIAKTNKELFDQLHGAAQVDFPKLTKQINRRYTAKNGFTEEDRRLELVTQALTRVYSKESKQAPRSIQAVLPRLVQWLLDLVKQVGKVLSGHTIKINPKDLSTGTTLSQLAKALNTYDSAFIIDPDSMNASFSLSSEKEAFRRRINAQANPLQREVIDDFFRPKNPVVFDPQQKAYLTGRKALYASLNTDISGSKKDAEGSEGLRKLFGKKARHVLELMALGERFEDIKDRIEGVSPAVASRAYKTLQQQLRQLVSPDSIIMPRMVIADHANKTASTLDFLVLDKDGGLTVINLRVSDTSYHDKQKYEQEQNKVGSASRLKGDSLSLHLEHGIKTAANWQMLRNNGYNVEDVYTLHIHLPKEKDQYILQVENLQRHKPTENRGWVKKILPVVSTPVDKIEQFKNGLGQGNPTRQPDFLSEEERMPEETPEEPIDHLTVDHEKLAQGRKSLANEVEELVKSVHSHPKSVMVQKLSELMKFVQHDLSKGEVTAAYGRFLRTSLEEVEKIMNYLTDETRIVSDPEFARVAIEAGWFIASYQGIGNAFKLHIGNQHHTGKLDELIGMLTTLDHKILSSLKKYIQYQVKTVSQKELTAKDLEKIVDEAIDISKADYLFGDMATSRDTLLAVADKIYKRQMIASRDEMVAFDKKVKTAANEYFRSSGGDNEMHMLIEDGTGRIVTEIGPQYHNLRDGLEAKTRTSEGVVKRYRDVDSLADADPADLEHNKDVYKNKQALRQFLEPEKQSETGVEDGMYHVLKTDFKTEREKMEKYTAIYDENNKFIRGFWEKKDPNMSDAVYLQYKRKYYQEVVYDKPVLKDGEFTGMVIKNGGKDWFVKEEYIEIRKVAGDGTDMVSAKWRALQEYAATSEKGKALLKFFQFYLDEMEETLKMLPPNVYKDMMGKLARIQANFIQRIRKSPNRFKAGAKTATSWFNMRVYAKSGMYNDDGTVMNQIPIFFVGNLRNEELIEKLSQELDQLDRDYKDNKIERLRYLEERSKKTEELKGAERAISHDEINTDFAENLIAFRAMAENYRHLNAIEGTVQAVERILAQRSYKKMAGENKLKMDPGTNTPYELKDGTQSYTYKRFKKWTEMVFYNSQDLDQSTFDVVVKKLMSFTSLESVGFNSFGAIHNYLMARINTIIESAGGTFYTRDSAWRAFKIFETEFLTGRFRSSGNGDDHYKTRRPGSKYEALVKLFHIYRQQQSGENRINFPTLGFPLMEVGEYSAQTKSGIAYLISHDLKNEFTNETVSIYDAFDFNEETGELTLKAGFTLDATTKLDITNSIWEMNKQIHGNYDWMDRMVIQQETVGQVAAQFHKWVYPAYKTYFQSRYFDENLGWLEGRFRTVYNLIRYIHQSEGNFLQKMAAGWKQLDDVQLKNMYKNAASLGFFIASFAAYGLFRSLAGDTPDDQKATKRWLNFFSWESDRVYKEVVFWAPGAVIGEQLRLIKNPFAIGTTMSQFTGMLAEGFKLAMPPYDNDVYYKHGPFEGELKFKKKLFDLLPVMKDINKWQSFSQVTNFQVQ